MEDGNTEQACRVCDFAECLYQFGRGVDFACAWGEVVDEAQLEECLFSYTGTIHRPTSGGNGFLLKCPIPGSLKSLQDRYLDSGKRFHAELRGRVAKHTGPLVIGDGRFLGLGLCAPMPMQNSSADSE
jgi:hypothetical protein